MVPDIMTFLYDEFLKAFTQGNIPKENVGTEPTLEGFIAFARKYLAEVNQPMSVTYLMTGLGLRLQQGQTVALRPQQENANPMRDAGLHITKPMTVPGQHGISDISSVPIIGSR